MLWDESTDDLVLAGAAKLYLYDAAGGESLSSDGTDLTINAGTDLNLTAGTDINIPADVGLTFGNDAEKIEGDGTDLTISGNNINLTATADVVIPANVGITFGTGEKIEGDSTDLTVTSGGAINLTATTDVVIPNNVGIQFGGASEKIEGDGTDLTISANNLTVDAAADIILDAAGNNVTFKSGGTSILDISNSSSDAVITSSVQDKDIIFKGDDNGSAITALTLDMSEAGAATFNNKVVATELDISGNMDIDGTSNLDAVDIDGAVQLDATFTVGADDQGYDVKLFGDTASAYMLWDTSADDLILAGAAGLIVPDGQFTLGSTAVTATAAEINLIDGGTSRGTTAVADGDGLLVNDGGTMRMTNVTTLKTYFQTGVTASSIAADDISTGDGAVTIATSSGNITIDATAGDTDIIFKGTDSAADITALTLDMSDAGTAIFNNDISLDSDSCVLKFGDDQDTTLTHTDGTGLTLNSTNKLCFQDTGTYVGSNADGDLDVVSDGTAVDSINLESAGGITLDAGTAASGIIYEDDGTEMLRIHNSSSDVIIEAKVQDKDIIFKGDDGGSGVTALTLDMSAGGIATFGAAANVAQQALTSSSNAVAWDASDKPNAYHQTSENTTFSAPSNAVEGAFICVEINFNGSHTIAWNTVFEFAASTEAEETATDGKTDIHVFRYNGAVWQEVGRTLNLAES